MLKATPRSLSPGARLVSCCAGRTCIILLVLYLCTYVGLLWFKRWARTLLAVAMVLSLVEPFLYRQEYPYSGIEEILSNLSDYLDGALLTLAWATDLRFDSSAGCDIGERPGWTP